MPEPLFADRRHAGQRLARLLARHAGGETLVLAIPRGGVVVGAEIARALQCPLDVLVARKLGAPYQPELAIGAVVSGDDTPLLDDATLRHLAVPEEYVRREIAHQQEELERQLRLYRGERPPPVARDRVAIVVDDGVATGSTLRVALASLRRQSPRRLVAAVPVAPQTTAAQLREAVDEFACLATPEPFISVGSWYEEFGQVSDEEVCALLAEFAPA